MSGPQEIIINGVRFRAVANADGVPEFAPADPTAVRSLGEIFEEAMYRPKAKTLISSMPAGPMAQPMNPYGTGCSVCQHPLIEQNCPVHPTSVQTGGDYVFVGGEYFHRKCLSEVMAQRTRELQEEQQ